MRSYEQISDIFTDLSPAEERGTFNIDWLADDTLAVGRDVDGRHAILIAGDAVVARRPNVGRLLRHSQWRTADDQMLTGNLLSLPQAAHFRPAAASISVELLRAGLGERGVQDVFSDVEPLIDLVVSRLLLPHEVTLGLLGELIVLEQLLTIPNLPSSIAEDPSQIWQGWLPKSRDFDLGRTGIEVKTTSADDARHHIHSLDQVECRKLDGGAMEELYLASVGLRQATSPGRISIARLTERLLARLGPTYSSRAEATEAQSKFLDRLAGYGPKDCLGYHHDDMREIEPYTQSYVTTYPPRLYDMSDPNVTVLRRADLAVARLLDSPPPHHFSHNFPLRQLRR